MHDDLNALVQARAVISGVTVDPLNKWEREYLETAIKQSLFNLDAAINLLKVRSIIH